MVGIEDADDELHRCLVSPATKRAADCARGSEHAGPGRCEVSKVFAMLFACFAARAVLS